MKLKPFVDKLPIPRVLQPKERGKDCTYYEVEMQEFFHQFHSSLKPTKVWGYEGQIPGPTIEVESGESARVLWKNNLPDKHFLPVDQSLHGAGHGIPEVRTVVHLHGALVEPDSDGYPEAWFTKDFQKCGPCFSRKVYHYPNNQPATALWYHDHALAITRLNVYAGLAGMYIIRDEQERALNLPSGIYEIPLVIQDKSFNADGSLFYPKNVDAPPPTYPEVSITPGFAGDTIMVNGKAWPYLEVEQRKYRFRILNASNERFYRLKLQSGQQFIQIGSDGGLLPRPVRLDEIVIGPSERMDVVLDFTNQPLESKIRMTNTARTPFDFGQPPDPETDGLVMEFRVIARTSDDTSTVPQILNTIKKYCEYDVKKIRDITIDVGRDGFQRLLFMLNNHEFMDGDHDDPVAGELEMWRIINPGLGVHPIHIHQIQFQVLDRLPFDTATFAQTGRIRCTDEPEPPPANERGWKDIIQAYPGQITRLLVRFGPYTGRYVYHCHILEHEDHDMMRPFDVFPCKHKPDKKDSCQCP